MLQSPILASRSISKYNIHEKRDCSSEKGRVYRTRTLLCCAVLYSWLYSMHSLCHVRHARHHTGLSDLGWALLHCILYCYTVQLDPSSPPFPVVVRYLAIQCRLLLSLIMSMSMSAHVMMYS